MADRENMAIVIGASAGGLHALSLLLSYLPADYPHPIVVVQHISESNDSFFSDYLNAIVNVTVKEAADKEPLRPGVVYIAPPGYHLLIEEDRSLSLSVDPPVHFSRPSIDVLFQSAASAYEAGCVGIVLTGANDDGSQGLSAIKEAGGFAVVQDPATAEYSCMPNAAIQVVRADRILPLEQMGEWLQTL